MVNECADEKEETLVVAGLEDEVYECVGYVMGWNVCTSL
jgi:hypothetical protein